MHKSWLTALWITLVIVAVSLIAMLLMGQGMMSGMMGGMPMMSWPMCIMGIIGGALIVFLLIWLIVSLAKGAHGHKASV